jgi:hypothetical protein
LQDQVTPEEKSAPPRNKKKRILVIGGLAGLGLLLVLIACVGIGYYYLSERTSSYEKDAIQGLLNIAQAQKTFMTRNFKYGTIDELDRSGQLNNYGDYLKRGTRGYRLDMEVDGLTFRARATPKSYGFGGGYRSFYVDLDGTVRGADKKGLSASASDPPAY